MLAWYRTAAALYALAVGLGGIVPKVAPTASSAYRVMGVIFAVLGASVALVAASQYRLYRQTKDLAEQVHFRVGFLAVTGLVVCLLGVAMAVVIALGA
jgi:uncharacterized membrane protein YidH (DUF202 family)